MGVKELDLSHLENSIKENKDIIAAMYTGSFGRDMSDKYSDLDIELVVNDKFIENSRKNVETLLNKIGKIKLLYFLDDKNIKSLIDDYQKIDIKLHTKESLVAREKYSKIKIIKDKDNLLALFNEQSKTCKTKVNDDFVLTELKEAILTQIINLNRCERGWLLSVAQGINNRVERLFVDLMKIRGKLQFDLSNAENLLNKNELKMLKDSYCKDITKKGIKKSLKSLWKFTKYIFLEYDNNIFKKLPNFDEEEFLKFLNSLR